MRYDTQYEKIKNLFTIRYDSRFDNYATNLKCSDVTEWKSYC